MSDKLLRGHEPGSCEVTKAGRRDRRTHPRQLAHGSPKELPAASELKWHPAYSRPSQQLRERLRSGCRLAKRTRSTWI